MNKFTGIVTENNIDIRGRLLNWKFESAVKYLSGENNEVVEIVTTMSKVFGNCGWFGGNMGNIVATVVTYLIGEEEE